MADNPTGIPCFECGERSGMDCAGRKPDEATRCEACMEKFMKTMEIENILNRISDEYRDTLKRLADS